MDIKETKTKITDFLSGKGFYFVLAGCLLATGVAAWTAYAGVNAAQKEKGQQIESSQQEPMSSETQNEPQDKEPYSSVTESSQPEESEPLAPPTVAQNFVYPLSGNTLRGYSDSELYFSETFADMRLHTALDLIAEDGAAVTACGNGIVTAVVADGLLGHLVEIDHGNGVTAKYCGLKEKTSVKVGDIVSAGSLLGYVGEIPAECTDTPHLHLEFYKDGYSIDPTEFIKR